MEKLVVLLTCLCILTACKGSEENIVHIYNWGEYMSDEAIKLFGKGTGYKVIYETYVSNEDPYVKLSPSTETYDVVVPSDYLIERCIEEDLVQKINKEAVPNLQGIFDSLKNPSYDPGSQYLVPYSWGTLGVVYSEKNVKEKLDSWDYLWDGKYKEKVLMYGSQRDSLAITLKRLGFNMNSKKIQELVQAKDSLIQQEPLIYAYLTDESRDVMV